MMMMLTIMSRVLVQIGGRRCHDMEERSCIMSQLGSLPTSSAPGSGHFTTADYRDLLTYSRQRHIQVTVESPAITKIRRVFYTYGDNDVITMQAGFRRHLVMGKTDKCFSLW